MIRIRYIDTSAFVKYYGKPEFEKGSAKVENMVNEAREGESILISSVLMIGEAVSVFDRWVRIKLIDAREFEKIFGRFLLEVEELIERGSLILETINPSFISSSIELIIRHHIPINDAIHLYTALNWRPEIKEFVCSDENLLRSAKKEGLNVLNPEI
jgi:predicted nucleic acid-binding protein